MYIIVVLSMRSVPKRRPSPFPQHNLFPQSSFGAEDVFIWILMRCKAYVWHSPDRNIQYQLHFSEEDSFSAGLFYVLNAHVTCDISKCFKNPTTCLNSRRRWRFFHVNLADERYRAQLKFLHYFSYDTKRWISEPRCSQLLQLLRLSILIMVFL